MNHLQRERAPINDAAWTQIDDEARRSLKQYLVARQLVDFDGPHGWEYSSVTLGRVERQAHGPYEGVAALKRDVRPLVEFRSTFSLSREEIDAAERGALDLDLSSVIAASQASALAEDSAIFHGYDAGDIPGIATASPHEPIALGNDFSQYPRHAAKAVAMLRGAGIAGPYAIALGSKCYTGVIETTEHGGYPVFQHLSHILGGPVVWAPAVNGALIVSQRGGDYVMTVGQDLSIGYLASDATNVELYIEESLTFRINTPEAAVYLLSQ